MTDFLFYGDTQRSPSMRHELPVSIGDPFLLAIVDSQLHVTASNLERNRVAAAAPDAIIHDIADLGFYELLAGGVTFYEIDLELASRAVAAMGVRKSSVDAEMPIGVADRLRADGILLRPDHKAVAARRRASRRPSLPAFAGRKSRRTPACAPPPSCCASRRLRTAFTMKG